MNTASWYYARAGAADRSGPLPTRIVQGMLADGSLSPDDLVWRAGLPGWVRAGSVPELSPEAAPAASLSRLRHWMTIAGILGIVTGIGGCLTIVGAVSGVLMIVAGTALLGARSALDTAPVSDPAWIPFFEQLGRYARATAWALVLGILSAVFFLCFYFGLFAGILTGVGAR
ncbi:MAG: DUF4339 domain-containing protein [Kiritimatiellae bacterium]|nr:DUF4339 domain-containing protein [Kiritimatiellia bacterium]